MACDLNLSEDQKRIVESASAMLASNFPLSRLRTRQSDSMDRLADFGAFALALPEELGGTGFTVVEEALLHALFGRYLVTTKSLAAPIAARLAGEIGLSKLALDIVSGKCRICPGLNLADSLLVIGDDGTDLVLVFGDRHLDLLDIAGLEGRSAEGLGHGISIAQFATRDARPVCNRKGGQLLNIADLLVSAQMLGIAEATRDIAVAYAGVREQFGKPIGAFQAIKHHCANMALGAELLSAQLDIAAIALRDGNKDSDFQIAALRLLAPQIALQNARICIQVHGAIGFSAEADVHHFVKQVHVLRQLGSGAPLLDQVAPLAHLEPQHP